MNDPSPNYFFAIEYDFFFVFLSVFSLCSLIVIFIDFHVKQKRSPQFKKKTRESKFENKAKNTSHTGLVHEID